MSMPTTNDNLPQADGTNQNQQDSNLENIETTGVNPIEIPLDNPVDHLEEEIEELPTTESAYSNEPLETSISQDDMGFKNSYVPLSKNKETAFTKEDDTTDSKNIAEEATDLDPVSIKEAIEAVQIDVPKDEGEKPTSANDFDDDADKDQTEDSNKEEEDDKHLSDNHPEDKDYEDLSFTEIVGEAVSLIKNYSPLVLKTAFTKLKDTFNAKSSAEEKEQKEKFIAEGGSEIDFRYDNQHKSNFYESYSKYREGIDKHYKERDFKEKNSLEERKSIIAELKALYTEPSITNNDIFKKYRELKSRWHNAGRISKTHADIIFKDYYFHLNNFHEFLDLNQELRKMEYEHNLNIRKSIIARATELLGEDNIQKALNELQYLHRTWKEEAVPVAEELREKTWQEFKDLTSKIHDRKNELNERINKEQEANLALKHEIIEKIKSLTAGEPVTKHNHWQKKINEMKDLREQFHSAGRVPKEVNQKTWDLFKEASRAFNHLKNEFYKGLKDEQMTNLEEKRRLVALAQEHKESTDWENSVNVVKKIQSEWKKVGHVPRKYSDKIWKEFSDANNEFFSRFKNRNNAELEKQQEQYDKKLALLEEIKKADKPTDKDEVMKWVNDYSVKWSQIGFVPHGKKDINKDFTTLTSEILKDAGIDSKQIEKSRFKAKINRIKDTRDDRELSSLKYGLRNNIEALKKEVAQMQTNMSFFSNAKADNPLMKTAISNLKEKENKLEQMQVQYDQLKRIDLSKLPEVKEEEE